MAKGRVNWGNGNKEWIWKCDGWRAEPTFSQLVEWANTTCEHTRICRLQMSRIVGVFSFNWRATCTTPRGMLWIFRLGAGLFMQHLQTDKWSECVCVTVCAICMLLSITESTSESRTRGPSLKTINLLYWLDRRMIYLMGSQPQLSGLQNQYQ